MIYSLFTKLALKNKKCTFRCIKRCVLILPKYRFRKNKTDLYDRKRMARDEPSFSLLIVFLRFVCHHTRTQAEKAFYPIPKYFSKNPSSLVMMPCFFSARLPPPKRVIGGISLSISAPVVLTDPSRNAVSINFRVSSGFSFSSAMIC